jgi:hypothetical protein
MTKWPDLTRTTSVLAPAARDRSTRCSWNGTGMPASSVVSRYDARHAVTSMAGAGLVSASSSCGFWVDSQAAASAGARSWKKYGARPAGTMSGPWGVTLAQLLVYIYIPFVVSW